MGEGTGFIDRERARAEAWKATTATLPADARRAAPYVRDGRPWGGDRGFCLPADHGVLNLLPEVRSGGLGLFAELGIPWHQGYAGGPSNHLLSSQVQCVNALGQMVEDPDRIVRAFAGLLGTAEVLEIEPGRYLTFEYIGDHDVFGEAPGRQRTRGAMCTSVDAAFVHRTGDGVAELVLVEWKYTESYRPRVKDPAKDATRWGRYGAALTAPDGPVRADVLAFEDLVDEPLYQLVRQQLLAWELEKAGAHGAERVRVVHVCPPANDGYQASLTRPSQQAVGRTTSAVWAALLCRPDRFVSLDPAVFLDPAITSVEYRARYGPAEDGPRAQLRTRLNTDPDLHPATLATDTDWRMSIGRDVWRMLWRDQVTTAVPADAGVTTTCNAVLDALAILEDLRRHDQLDPRRVDGTCVNVLVDRPPPAADPTETDEALRSLRDAATGTVTVRVFYADPAGGWVPDTAPAPRWGPGDRKVTRWVSDLLVPRLTATPPELAVRLVEAVGDPSLHLYPTPIRPSTPDRWALRIDGLQIGTVTATEATLSIGKTQATGDGPQRKVFTEVFGAPTVTVAAGPGGGGMTVEEAAERIRVLLGRFRSVDIAGAPATHRRGVIDEHNLEARLLKGIVTLDDTGGHQLIGDDTQVARGSQFPTLWGHRGRPRYLDAMLRRGTTPVAVELKVPTGGQGRYYRRALTQAVLYRHFIHHAPDLEPWFAAAGLDRTATVAAVALPAPGHRSPDWKRDVDLLRAVASHLDVEVHLIDDRRIPDTDPDPDVPEPDLAQVERLTWTLAAALQRRWSVTLGWVIATHPAGGLYDMIGLREVGDRTIEWHATRPWVVMNRPGAIRTYSVLGTETWAWGAAWAALAEGTDPDEVARTLGSVAGLGAGETGRTVAFGAMAAELHRIVNDPQVIWRTTDYADGDRPPGSRWHAELPAGTVLVDQDDLRTWARTTTGTTEVHDPDLLVRIGHALELLGYQPTPPPPLAPLPPQGGTQRRWARPNRGGAAGRTIRLPNVDAPGAAAAIDRLRDSHGRADSMANALQAAVDARVISEEGFIRHSRWCHSERTYAAGVDPARDAAHAMYGTIPPRLRDKDNTPVPDADTLLAEARRRIEEA